MARAALSDSYRAVTLSMMCFKSFKLKCFEETQWVMMGCLNCSNMEQTV